MDENQIFLIISLQQLLESKAINQGENNTRSKALSEKIGQLLETIPEFDSYLDENDKSLKKKLFVELGRYIKYAKYEKGEIIHHFGEDDKKFYMNFHGKIIKINIIYKTIYASLKEYILHLAKLLIINEKYLYSDCIKKNKKIFPIKETINIMDYGNNIKTFDFEEEIEKIKNKKNEVFIDINDEEKNKKKLNIKEILSLFNPSMEEKTIFFNGEQKFAVYLPFFYVENTLDSGSFIGNLNKSHGIKIYSTYMCLNTCDIFYVDKTIIKNDFIFNHFHNNKCEKISNILFKKHYIFRDSDMNFLAKNYSKFIEIVKLKKGDNLFLQNSIYEGVFFLVTGVVQVKSNRSYNELNELKYNILKNNITNLSGNNLDSFRDKKRDSIIQRLLRNPLFIKKSNEINEINFGTFVETEIIGLSDLYDKNNGIYNFSVQCLSTEAELFFAPKEIFTSILTNPEIEEKINKLTTEKIKVLKLKIKRFTDLFELEFDKLSAPIKDKNEFNFNDKLIINHNNNDINNNKKLKLMLGNLKFKFIPSKLRQRKLFRAESETKMINIQNNQKSNKDTNNFFNDNSNNKFIYYNKRYNNLFNNNDEREISTNQTRFSRINKSIINNESKIDEMILIKNRNPFRVKKLFLNQNKKLPHSLSQVNIKSNSTNNNFNNFTNTKRNINLFKFSSSIYNKQYFEIGRNRYKEKIDNLYPTKSLDKMNDNDVLIMPILKTRRDYNLNYQIKK